MSRGRVLIIAGSDSGGGAGVQADIKTVTMLGGYAMTAITAVTVQNTQGVFAVHPVPQDVIAAQIRVVLDDLGADAIKIGMLGDAATAETVAKTLNDAAPAAPVILDPVMVAKGGHALLQHDAVDALKALLLPRAALVTPNAPEASRLTGVRVEDEASQAAAGRALVALGAKAALVKGGHVAGAIVRDVLVVGDEAHTYAHPRIDTAATHGTGCTLASAIAAYVAQGASLADAVPAARDYLIGAIRNAPGFGAGHGPLAHNWLLRGRS